MKVIISENGKKKEYPVYVEGETALYFGELTVENMTKYNIDKETNIIGHVTDTAKYMLDGSGMLGEIMMGEDNDAF